MRPPIARETGSTAAGSEYVIEQDTPTTFHISMTNPIVNRNDIWYDFVFDPPSIQDIYNKLHLLEKDILENKDR